MLFQIIQEKYLQLHMLQLENNSILHKLNKYFNILQHLPSTDTSQVFRFEFWFHRNNF